MDNNSKAFSAAAAHSKTDSTIGLGFYQSEDGAGSLSHLQTLFQSGTDNSERPQHQQQQPQQQQEEEEESALHRKDTRKGSNRSRAPFASNDDPSERTSLLGPPAGPPPTGNNNGHYRDDSFLQQRSSSSYSRPSYDSSTLSDLFTPKMGSAARKFGDSVPLSSPPDNGTNNNNHQSMGKPPSQGGGGESPTKNEKATTKYDELVSPSTYIGGFMFVLYHVVFCLAAGSAIQRPHAKNSLLGLMTKMGALGVLFAGPVYLINIGNGIPSMYPTCDLFLAPFFASIAKIIDEELSHLPDITDEENDEIFLCTFGFLAFVGMGLAGTLLILAGVFKLANLGAFLPFPVLCGFFTAVGIMTWQLGFVVDTSGKNFAAVFIHGDRDLILYALLHHIPGVIVAVIMKYLGPKNPLYVVLVLFATIAAVYGVMFASGTSMDEARAQGWFWYHDDIVYKQMSASVGFRKWLPPAPFGMLNGLFMGKIHWAAVWKGLQPACALSFLYLIRCALHSAALLKNIPSLGRTVKVFLDDPTAANPKPRKKTRMEMFSEIVDIEEIVKIGTGGVSTQITATEIERATPTTWTLKGVLIQYGIAQMISACVGSWGVIPSVATSHAMFSLKAERVAPQLCSIVMLSAFYLTDFRLIAYMPKMAFSCLLTLAFIDIVLTWFIRSYFKTKSKQEWLVVPFIVVFAFGIGLLQAVFFGIGISTFLFVGAFFRSGVVKFAASGLSVRSTIERPASSAQWLDEHGDLIQVVILQNYLFFGNASSILAYCASMFEEVKQEDDPDMLLPPVPKFVILDMALVTGMDTSTVDILSDILNLCKRSDCKLFLSGMSAGLRDVLAHAGVKPLGGERSERPLRFFSSLDAAIGKAEDVLLNFQMQDKPPSMRKLLSLGEDSGFQVALRLIDEQNATSFAQDLAELEEYTTPIELEPNESLYDSPSRPERGLFFIEKGVIKIERDSGMTANTRSLVKVPGNVSDGGTISGLRMRSGSIGRDYAKMKAMNSHPQQQSFRLARVGAGWVVGTVEAVSGLEKVGLHLAVTSCRLHYLSYSEMNKLEETNPILMLRLYKLLSHIMAKQQEVTIGQLGTLHTIMSSPAQNKPIGRRAALSFQQLQ